MKKYTPYIFPLVVLSVVFLLVFRWYSMRTDRLETDLFAEGVEIENLSEDEMVRSINGVGDYDSVELGSESEDSQGVVRYEVKEGKVRFSVVANLPESDMDYSVWLKEVDGDAMREVFTLVSGKGGYVGSAALPSELMPFEIIVSEESNAADVLEMNILRGVVEVEEVVEEEAN
jgi:hypothetical protein